MMMIRKQGYLSSGDTLSLPAKNGSPVCYNAVEHGEFYIDVMLPDGGWSTEHPPCQSWWCRLVAWWKS